MLSHRQQVGILPTVVSNAMCLYGTPRPFTWLSVSNLRRIRYATEGGILGLRMDIKPEKPPDETPEQRLQRLLQANGCIVYHNELPDPEFPTVKCSIYGAPKTNELFVRLTNGVVGFVAVAQSPVVFPVMADRIFGLDVLDHAVAFELADLLWEAHRGELIEPGGRRRARP